MSANLMVDNMQEAINANVVRGVRLTQKNSNKNGGAFYDADSEKFAKKMSL